MKKLNREQKDALVNVVKQMTGAESVVIMLADTKIPCEEDLEYGSCNSQHHFESMAYGFRGDKASGFLAGWLDQMMRHVAYHPKRIILDEHYEEGGLDIDGDEQEETD